MLSSDQDQEEEKEIRLKAVGAKCPTNAFRSMRNEIIPSALTFVKSDDEEDSIKDKQLEALKDDISQES